MADLSISGMTVHIALRRRPWWQIARRTWRGVATYWLARREGKSRMQAVGLGWFVTAFTIQTKVPQ